MKLTMKDLSPELVVKRAMWLAYQASRPVGAGYLQVRDGMTEADVWSNLYDGPMGGDYPARSGSFADPNRPGKVYGDYVYGRMMKVGFKWDSDSITVQDEEPRRDYQGWCWKYPTYLALIQAAVESLKAEKAAK